MKRLHQLPFLVLLFILISLFTASFTQAQAVLGLSGNEMCLLNNGPYNNCESVDGQILLLDYDSEEGYSLEGLNFPYPVDLANEAEVSYMDVYDSPIEAMTLDGNVLVVAFVNAPTATYDMESLEQIGFYFSQSRTAVVKKCYDYMTVTELLDTDPCQSLSISLDPLSKVQVQTGIGTILILDELSDTTLMPPMDDMAKGAPISLGDPYGLNNLNTMTYLAGVQLVDPDSYHYYKETQLACNPEHRAATIQSCSVRVSIFSQILICGNYLIIKDPLASIPYFFNFSQKVKVYLYLDHNTNDIVVWSYGNCQTF